MEKSKTQMDHGDFCSRIREEILQYTEDIRSPETARILTGFISLCRLIGGLETMRAMCSDTFFLREPHPLRQQAALLACQIKTASQFNPDLDAQWVIGATRVHLIQMLTDLCWFNAARTLSKMGKFDSESPQKTQEVNGHCPLET